MKKIICRFMGVFLVAFLQVPSIPANAQTTKAGQAGEKVSVSQCYDRLKEAFEKRRVPTPDPFCLLTTEDGIQIESSANRKDYKPSVLLSSDVGEFVRAFLTTENTVENIKSKELQLRDLEIDRVFRMRIAYRDADGNEIGFHDRSIGGGPEYAVLGQNSMYWIRCNAGRDDHCVMYTNLYGRNSPDGLPSSPGGLPWPEHQSPCYFFMKHSFKELGGGAGLPGVVDTVEALMRKMHEDPAMPAIYERFCNWRQNIK